MTPTGWEVTVRIPMRLHVLPNMRVHRRQLAELIANTRRIVGLELQVQARPFRREWEVMKANPRLRLQVLQVRNGPKLLDDDNCTGSFKPVRDAVATFFGIDDGRRDRWVWLPCEQQRGDYAVRVHLQVVKVEAEPALVCCGVEREPGLGKYGCPNCNGEKRAKSKKFNPTPNVRKPR